MDIFISHHSACQFWLGPFAKHGTRLPACRSLPSPPLAGIPLDPEDFTRLGIDVQDIHLAIVDSEQRLRRKRLSCHVVDGPIPHGAFEQTRSDLWVACPELAFCQMARYLSFPELVKLGYELCARFFIDPWDQTPTRREPATTVREIRRFLRAWGNRRGANQAARALQYVCDDAESPMEIAMAMLLTLPKMYGGYGLPRAELNREVIATGRSGKRSARTYRGDLVWPANRLIVEYDSKLFHANPGSIERDSERRNNLQDAGWRVVTLTRQHANSRTALDEAAAQLLHALGVRNDYTPRYAAERRAALRRLLLPWALPDAEI